MTDRRAVARQRTFMQAVLSFQNGMASADCLVRNLTERGAQIELRHPHAPETFELLVPARGLRASARIVWRVGARSGLRLDRIAAVKPGPRPAARDDGY